MKINWKVLAIVFIILFIIETIVVIGLYNFGLNILDNENECAYNICEVETYDTYYYDYPTKFCYCYIDHEIVLEKYIGK